MSEIAARLSILLVMTALWSAVSRPSNTSRATAEGVEAYRSGRASESRNHFERALEIGGRDAVLELNAATAALEARQFDRGLQLNAEVAKESEVLADDAMYNSGTAFLRQQRAAEAVELLRESLRRNPDHLDAKRNLELAERLRDQRNRSGGDTGQQEREGRDESGEQGAAEGGEQRDPEGNSERGEVRPEEILRAVAQQEAEELRRMRAARSQGERRGSGW